MRLLCPACNRLEAPGAFRVEGESLFLSCSACGVESRAELAAPTLAAASGASVIPIRQPKPVDVEMPAGAWLQPPSTHCPKCVAERSPGASHCTGCGLSFPNARPDDYLPSAEVLEQWRSLTGRWQQTQAHDQLLQTAVAKDQLAPVGRLYRVRLAREPSDLIAQRGRDEVLRLATAAAALPATAKETSDPTKAIRYAGYALFPLMLIWLLFYVVRS